MSVYVDEFQHYGPTKIRCFKAGSSHMMADTVEELHAMAERIGLHRVWFQPLSSPHYDLTESRRTKALAAGAVFVPAKEQAARRIEARNAVARCEVCGGDKRYGGNLRGCVCPVRGQPDDGGAK